MECKRLFNLGMGSPGIKNFRFVTYFFSSFRCITNYIPDQTINECTHLDFNRAGLQANFTDGILIEIRRNFRAFIGQQVQRVPGSFQVFPAAY